MKTNAFGYQIKPLVKICLAGLFIALTAILQKVTAINYIPIVPFLRLSLGGPALIIFSSLMLGPFYGLLIGAASDLFGYLIFDPKSMALMPQITCIYALLGFGSYFVFLLFKKLKNYKLAMTVEGIIFGLLAIGVSLYFSLNDSIVLYSKTYNLELWQKIGIPCVVILCLSVLFLATLIIHKKVDSAKICIGIWHLSISLFVIELVIMVLFGSAMKAWAFNFDFFTIMICQIIVLFFNVPINTIFLSIFLRTTNRFTKVYNGDEYGK